MKNVKRIVSALVATMAMSGSACTGAESDEVLGGLVEDLVANGLSCGNQARLASQTSDDARRIRDDVTAAVGVESVSHTIELQATCGPPRMAELDDGLGITPWNWRGESIEERSGTSGVTGLVFRDAANVEQRICGRDWIADFVVRFRVAGAFARRDRLRIRGTNWWATLYLGATSDARVHSDDDVEVCIGYKSVFLTGAVTVLPGDLRMWLE
jgi:hypothetical protein